MNKSNPIGVRFNTELLNYLKEMDGSISPQKALSIYEECFIKEFSLFGQKPFKPIHIYKLINPLSNEIFYVGRTTFLLQHRLTNHVGQRRSKCQGVNQKKNEVINEIIEAGEMPTIELIETIHPMDDSEYNGHHDREIYWIAKCVLDNQPLVNRIPDKAKEIVETIKKNNEAKNQKRNESERNTPHTIGIKHPIPLEEKEMIQQLEKEIREVPKDFSEMGRIIWVKEREKKIKELRNQLPK